MSEIIRQLEKEQLKKNVADVRVGDSVKVHYKIREGNKDRVQIFQGLVIGTSAGKSLQGSFVVRKVVAGVGVERTFPLHSPWIVKIERTKTGKVRRAKLNFVRRYALSSKFKLKDKSKEGTIWEEIAEEHKDIEKEATTESHAEIVPEVVEDEIKDAEVAQDTTEETSETAAESASENSEEEPKA